MSQLSEESGYDIYTISCWERGNPPPEPLQDEIAANLGFAQMWAIFSVQNS